MSTKNASAVHRPKRELSPEFKAKLAPSALHEDATISELS